MLSAGLQFGRSIAFVILHESVCILIYKAGTSRFFLFIVVSFCHTVKAVPIMYITVIRTGCLIIYCKLY